MENAFTQSIKHFSKLQQKKTTDNFSHDIKSILQSIQSAAELLENHIHENTKQLKPSEGFKIRTKTVPLIKRIKNGTQDILSLLEELKSVHLNPEVVHFEKNNLKLQLDKLVEDFQNVYSMGKRVYEFHNELRNTDHYYDKNKMDRIIRNLLSNATKYTDEGVIIVHAEESEDSFSISVKDPGVGIPENRIDKIFLRHGQSGGSHQKSGDGLGLNIVQELVNVHQGKIEVSSIPGLRTVFKITIPKNVKALA